MSDGLLVGLFFLCVVLSAFFSGSETALTSVTETALFRHREDRRQTVDRLLRIRANLPQSLSALLIGNTLVNIAAGSIGTALAFPRLGERWGMAAATAGTTLILLAISEVTPKMLATRRPAEVALAVAWPVEILTRAVSPLAGLLTGLARAVLKPFGRADASRRAVTEEDVRNMISLSHEGGALETEEKEILHAVLDFGEVTVKDVMSPRGLMVSIPAASTFAEVKEVCRLHGYSRYPVWKNERDDVVGFLHVKDLFQVTDEGERSFKVGIYLHPAVFVPETKRADTLFREMRRRRYHMAIVVDERGGVSGFVTLEHLIERILGDIADEHDEPAAPARSEGTSLVVEGRYLLSSLEKDLHQNLDETEAETSGGFLLKKFGRIPRTGARMTVGDLEFLVERATPRSIERIRITRKGEAP